MRLNPSQNLLKSIKEVRGEFLANVDMPTTHFLLAVSVATFTVVADLSCAGYAEEVKTTQTLEQTVTESPSSMAVPATTRTDAMMRARIGAGRTNPFASSAGSILKTTELMKASQKVHIPPPPKSIDSHLAPPPPPTAVTLPNDASQAVGSAGMGNGESDLPEPPEKPLIAEKMKLVGVVADKAFFTFTDLELKRANKFPSTVVLSNGEQFESVHLVSIASNSVVLEEDGERITKELERIR